MPGQIIVRVSVTGPKTWTRIHYRYRESEFGGRKYLWPCTTERSEVVVEEGEHIIVEVYRKSSPVWAGLFRARRGARAEVDYDVIYKVIVENAEFVEQLTEEKLSELKQAVLDEGYALARDPDKATLNAYALLLKRLSEQSTEDTTVELRIRVPKSRLSEVLEKLRELGVEVAVQ